MQDQITGQYLFHQLFLKKLVYDQSYLHLKENKLIFLKQLFILCCQMLSKMRQMTGTSTLMKGNLPL